MSIAQWRWWGMSINTVSTKYTHLSRNTDTVVWGIREWSAHGKLEAWRTAWESTSSFVAQTGSTSDFRGKVAQEGPEKLEKVLWPCFCGPTQEDRWSCSLTTKISGSSRTCWVWIENGHFISLLDNSDARWQFGEPWFTASIHLNCYPFFKAQAMSCLVNLLSTYDNQGAVLTHSNIATGFSAIRGLPSVPWEGSNEHQPHGVKIDKCCSMGGWLWSHTDLSHNSPV